MSAKNQALMDQADAAMTDVYEHARRYVHQWELTFLEDDDSPEIARALHELHLSVARCDEAIVALRGLEP